MEKSIVDLIKRPKQIDGILLRAKLLAKRNEWNQAKEVLVASMPETTENAERCYYLAHCYFNLNEFEKAVPFAEKAVEIIPTNASWLHRLASLYARTRQHAKAADVFAKLTEMDPSEAKWHYHRGRALLAIKKNAEGLDELRIATAIEPQNREFVNFLSEQFQKRKIYWEQALLLERSIPSMPSEYATYGRALLRMNQFLPAAEALSHAADRILDDAVLAYEAGLAFERHGDMGNALKYYDLAISRDTLLGSRSWGIGAFHEKYKHWNLAAYSYEKKISSSSDVSELHFRAGLANDRLFRWHIAESHYRNAVRIQPSVGRWHYKLALSLERQEKWLEAAEVYEYAAEVFNNSYWWYRAGLAWHKSESIDAAFRAFGMSIANFNTLRDEFAASVGTSDSSYLRNLLTEATPIPVGKRSSWFEDRADLWFKLGEVKHGISCLERALLARDVHAPYLISKLAIAHAHENQLVRAVDLLRNYRVFKWQDGIDVENRTKNVNIRNIAEYAEYYNDLKIDPFLIIWQSNGGESIGCHPLALFEEFENDERFASFKHIWVLNNDSIDVPATVRDSEHVVFVKRHSDGYRRALASAKFLVNNSTFPGYFIRRDGQKYLNTWHGTPYKTLGKDMRGEMFKHASFVRDILQATHMISPNDHTTKVLMDSHDVRGLFSGRIAEIGSPRIDKTINLSEERRRQICEQLSISDDKPVILYAPTWRGTSNQAVVDSELLIDHIARLSNIDGHLLFRAHRLEERALQDVNVDAKVVPASIDTNELLAIVDLLITDYSSIFYDYLPLDRPIVFFMYDQEEYVDERGVYFENEELPGYIEKSANDVVSRVHELLGGSFQPNRKQATAREVFCAKEDGKAARRVLDFWIDDNASEGLVDTVDDRKTLVFQQSMIPTGMSSSFLNLVNGLDPDLYRVVLLVEPRLILSDTGRQETIKRLPANVQVIGRSGGRVMTPEDLWVSDMVDGTNQVLSPELWNSYMRSYERESRRIFGAARVAASVQFDGYVPFWNGISATIGQEDTARIIYLHNDMYQEWDKRWPNLELTFAMYASFDSLISVSETMRDVNLQGLSKKFNVSASKFDFCENMINAQDILERSIEDLPEAYAALFEKEGQVFLTSGRLSIEKDQQKLIRAFAIHHRSHPEAHLVLLGDGPLRAELQALTSELGLANHVTFLGRVANPYPFVSKADCFVLPSNHEGQPMVLLEALVLGKKIIATNIPGSAHVLRNGYGLIVENSIDGVRIGLENFQRGEIPHRPFDYADYSKSALQSFEEHLIVR